MAKENPDKFPSRMGQPWSTNEVNQLLASIRDKKSFEDIVKEHQRTDGGIHKQLRRMAHDYYNNGKTIEEIQTITGLSAVVIAKTIEKLNGTKIDKPEKKENVLIPEVSLPRYDIEIEMATMKAEMAEMKQDIKEILMRIKAVYEFEDS